MDDIGFNGSGSLFVSSRFKAGDPVSAKQLNQLAAAVQTALPMPYLGDGSQVSYTGGGSIILSNQSTQTKTSPKQFTVTVTKVGEEYRFNVTAGTINGLVPCIGGGHGFENLLTATSPVPYGVLSFSGEGNCWLYLRAGPKSGTAKVWPDPNIANDTYPNVIGFNAIQSDTDDYGHILVALVNKNPDTQAITVSQFLQNSVWSQRNKYTLPNSSYYFFWPI
jgi:hypothetical protein